MVGFGTKICGIGMGEWVVKLPGSAWLSAHISSTPGCPPIELKYGKALDLAWYDVP